MALAQKFKTTIEAILALNPSLVDPDRIYVGQKIRIPDNR